MSDAATSAVPADRREAILDAALTLFAERGFHGTSVPGIARLAGVGAGTIYRYFEGKDALVNTLYQRHRRELGKSLRAGFDPGGPPRAVFRDLWQRAVAFAQQQPRAFQFLELHHHASYLDGASLRLDAELLAAADGLVQVAIARRVLKEMPAEVLLAVVCGALRGLVQAGFEKRLQLDEPVISQAEACLWEALRR